jgi:hypothetical protein
VLGTAKGVLFEESLALHLVAFYLVNSVGWGNWDAADIPSLVTSVHFIFFRRWLILSLRFRYAIR